MKLRNKYTALLMALILAVAALLGACSTSEATGVINTPDANIFAKDDNGTETPGYTEAQEPELNEDDILIDFDNDAVTEITFEDDSISVNGGGAAVTETTVSILQSGIYRLRGTLDDGQVLVNTDDDGTVFLILEGVNIHSSNSAAIYVVNAEKTVISLAEGTANFLSDGTDRVFADTEDEEPDSALFSEDDLTINGSGSLTVEGTYKHGIVGKDNLTIVSGNITIKAVSDGIRGRDSLVIADGNINITAENDGMQSNNDEDSDKGYIVIESGIINIESGNDGIQAETNVVLNGGEINIFAGGGTQNIVVAEDVNEQMKDSAFTAEETESTKGIKAGELVQVNNGTVVVDSHDDTLHCDNYIEINGGTLLLSTDDDGIHADSNIIINNGYIDIQNCNEGVESAVITVNDGEIRMNASDDGFNASDGTGTIGMPGNEAANPDCALYINGGYIVIYSNADSVDSNGNIYMTGGTVIAEGPQSYTNGALDSDGEFVMDGGLIIAVGSSGMAESPDPVSSQNALLYLYDNVQPAGSLIYIESEDGEQLLAYKSTKEYQSLAFSSPDLKSGMTYTVYSGGSIDSDSTDGFYEEGNHSGGTVIGTFAVSSTLTVVGTQSRGGGQPGGRGPGGR